MFLVNSCLGHFSAASFLRLPLLRTYGVNLPSSLTTLLPLVLGFSPHPPVSVCGTGIPNLASSFSRQSVSVSSVLIFPYPSRLHVAMRTSLHDRYLAWASASSRSLTSSFCVPASLNRLGLVQDCLPVVHRLRLAASP